MLYPLTGLGGASGSPRSALGWAIGIGLVVAVLAGIGAAVGVQTNHPTGWSLLLAAIVFLNPGVGINNSVFSSALTHATAEFTAAIIAAFVAFASFQVAHGKGLKKATHASAA